MALVNYMGDAPGTMAYQRQRSRQPLGFQRWQKPMDKMPGMDDDLEIEGLPGDAQWFYNNQKRYKSGLQSLYSQYGGEMDWVMADPKWKGLAATQNMYAYNTQSIERNHELAKARDVALRTYGSGQQESQYELVDVGGGNYMMKRWLDKGKGMTKGDYLQEVVRTPNLVTYADGTQSIKPVQFDRGTGDMDKFNAMLNSFFSDRGINTNEWDNLRRDKYDNLESQGYGIAELHRRGGINANNYEQVAAAVDYVRKYGLDENHEYFIRQEMFDAYHKGKSFVKPKQNEDGSYVRDKKGNLALENYRLTWEDVNDPQRMAELEEYYFQSRVGDYAEKLKEKKTKSVVHDEYDYVNIDPISGQPVRDESQFLFTNIAEGKGPEVNQTGVTNTIDFNETLNGKPLLGTDDYMATQYNKQNLGQAYWKMAEDGLFRKGETTMYDLTRGRHAGMASIGGHWEQYSDEDLKSMIVVGLDNITNRNLPGLGAPVDPKNPGGTRKRNMGWVGEFTVIINEDSPLIEKGRLKAHDRRKGHGDIKALTSGNSRGEEWAQKHFQWKTHAQVNSQFGTSLSKRSMEVYDEYMVINVGTDLTEVLPTIDMQNPSGARSKEWDIHYTSSWGDHAEKMRQGKDIIATDPDVDVQATIPK